MAVSKMATGRRGQVEGERLVVEYEASELGRKAFYAARSISAKTSDYQRRRVRQQAGDAGFMEPSQ